MLGLISKVQIHNSTMECSWTGVMKDYLGSAQAKYNHALPMDDNLGSVRELTMECVTHGRQSRVSASEVQWNGLPMEDNLGSVQAKYNGMGHP